MSKLKLEHIEYLKDSTFLQEYLKRLRDNIIFPNNKKDLQNIKNHKSDYDINKISAAIDSALELITIALNVNINPPITEELIEQIADTVNENADYILYGYRNHGKNIIIENKFSLEPPENIPNKMKELINHYNNEWTKLDIFEREARFNIELQRIHPFEDGNGRTGKILLIYNMLRQGHAPILIGEKNREAYLDARYAQDIQKTREIFEEESQKELLELDKLIAEYEKQNNHPKKH